MDINQFLVNFYFISSILLLIVAIVIYPTLRNGLKK